MEAKEIVFNNIEILINIFQYVNFHEQLKLTRVCSSFQHVIVNYLWKLKYKALEVMRTSNYYILINRINGNCLELEVLETTRTVMNYNEFDEFLNINSNNVQILKLLLERRSKDKSYVDTHFDIKYKFPNLTSLQFVNDIISEDSLNMLSTFCPQLEKLCFKRCSNSRGEYLKVENIHNIKTLKYLEFEDSFEDHRYIYSDIMKTLMKLKLLHVIIDVPTMSDDDKEVIFPCKVLKLGPLNCLTKLTIDIETEGNGFFYELLKSCKNLAYLELKNCTLSNIAWPKTLNELVLINCSGLTCWNLRCILCDLKLKAFTSTYTDYSGRMTPYITTSKTLEYLYFDEPQIAKFFELQEFNGFLKLSFLKYDPSCDINDDDYYVFAHLSKQCPNIRKLYMEDTESVSIDDLYKLESLEKLEVLFGPENILYLLLILKHSSLRHLIIQEFYYDLNSSFKNDKLLDLKTNLLLITIPLDMFEYFQDFWLDLLSINPKLHLMLQNLRWRRCVEDLKSLITDPKFPERLKTINICGFVIECCQLLRDELDVAFVNLLESMNDFYIIL